MESAACLVSIHINTRRDMADGKSGTRKVSIRMLQPRPRALCLPSENEVCYPVDNDVQTNVISSIPRSSSHPSKTGKIIRKTNTPQEELSNVKKLTNAGKIYMLKIIAKLGPTMC